MSLAPGTRVGHYEISSQIGAGGMGEVYRARDTRLKRDVAAKVLPAAVASDPDRLARFQREAEVLASLNHPNIAAIYGLEQASEAGQPITALVMELIEGPTLADRLASCGTAAGLPVDEALPIAAQVADALEAAHERGIVHRDLKPANIKVRPDGTVKVLDFGLAKAMEPAAAVAGDAPSMSPTITSPAMTQLGMILGTAAYMAPEQARGRAVDRRADIWAFGCVLYEMLTGRRAFEAEDVSLTLARVLERDVDLDALPAHVPPRVRQAIRVCLRKDPKQRASDIRDVRLALEGAFESPAAGAAPGAIPLWRHGLVAGVALLAGVAIGALALGMVSTPDPPARPVTQFDIRMEEGQVLSSPGRQMLDISPDGSRIVFVSNQQLYLRSLGDAEARPLTGTGGFALVNSPKFSPDGQSIIFWSGTGTSASGTWRRIPAAGGASVALSESATPLGVSWVGEDIVYGQGLGGIMRLSANGGTPERVVDVAADEVAGNPHLLPGGDVVLFSFAKRNAGVVSEPQIVAQSLVNGTRRTIVPSASDARYVDTGHLLYVSGGVALAAPFDVDDLAVTGSATPIVEGVRMGNGRAQIALSDSGTLVYVPGPITAGVAGWRVARVTREGGVEALPIPPGAFSSVRVSRDGRQLALGSDDGKEAFVSIYDLQGGARPRRLTFDGRNQYPVWSNDGQYVAFQSARDGDVAIFRQRADGAGVAERLTRPDRGTVHIPESWSHDGSRLLYSAINDGRSTVWSLTLSDGTSAPLATITSGATSLPGSVLSPDGRWIAYTSRDARATSAVYVQPFPPTGTRYQISRDEDDAHHPVWTMDGKELIFTPGSGTRVSVVPVTTGTGFSFGAETVLLRPFRNSNPSTVRTYDVASEGNFIALVDPGISDTTGATDRIRVVLNWTEELKRRVPVR